jgi:hypothetical protein
MIYVVKKVHARGIYFVLQTRDFWHFSSAPSSLFERAAIYSPVPFIGCTTGSLSSSFNPVVLPI